jgi:uncharacterized membrane protein YcaP (DUF421 family)
MFRPDTPLLEIFIRGTVMYVCLFFLLRIVLRRQSGSTGMSDLLVLVLLADAAQNAMSGQYQSITDGLLLVGVIVGWSYLFDFLAYHSDRAARIIRPRPMRLIEDGQVSTRNLRRELVSEKELRGLLREQGIQDVRRVKEAWMESDGQLSVIADDEKSHHETPERKKQESR